MAEKNHKSAEKNAAKETRFVSPSGVQNSWLFCFLVLAPSLALLVLLTHHPVMANGSSATVWLIGLAVMLLLVMLHTGGPRQVVKSGQTRMMNGCLMIRKKTTKRQGQSHY